MSLARRHPIGVFLLATYALTVLIFASSYPASPCSSC